MTAARFLAGWGAVAIVLFAGWGVAILRPPEPAFVPVWNIDEPFVGPHQINGSHGPIYGGDTRGQSAALKAMLVLTAAWALALMSGGRKAPWWLWAWGLMPAGYGVWVYVAHWRGMILWPDASVRNHPLIGGGAFAALLLAFGPALRRRGPSRAFGAVVLLSFAAFHLPALFPQHDWSKLDWDGIELFEMHLAVASSAGDRLAAGHLLYDGAFPYYGLANAIVAAGCGRLTGGLTIHGNMALFAAFQAAYVACFLYGYWRTARGRWFAAAVPAGLALCLYAYGHHLTYYPNHLAYRYLPIAAAPAAMIALRNWAPRRAAFAHGVLAGWLFLHNPETGIAAGVGIAAFLFFRVWCSEWRSVGRGVLALLFALGLAAAVAAFVAAYRLAVGDWPRGDWPIRLLDTLRFVAGSGYSGLPFAFHPAAVLVFAHAAWTIFAAARRPLGTHGFFGSLRPAVAATIMVAFGYYANRSQEEKLYAPLLLYGYLLADVGRLLLVARFRPRRLALPALVAAAAIVAGYAPIWWAMARRETGRYGDAVRAWPDPLDAKRAFLCSGLRLPNDDRGRALREKADYLAEVRRAGAIGYVTVNPYLLPKLSGVHTDLPYVDVCWESIARPQYDRFLAGAFDPARQRLLIDDPSSIPLPEPQPGDGRDHGFRVPKLVAVPRTFFERLRRDLGREYRRVGVVHGWEDWRRLPAGKPSAAEAP